MDINVELFSRNKSVGNWAVSEKNAKAVYQRVRRLMTEMRATKALVKSKTNEPYFTMGKITFIKT